MPHFLRVVDLFLLFFLVIAVAIHRLYIVDVLVGASENVHLDVAVLHYVDVVAPQHVRNVLAHQRHRGGDGALHEKGGNLVVEPEIKRVTHFKYALGNISLFDFHISSKTL